MRDLDRRDLITGDFIFITGDVISNLSLEPVLAKPPGSTREGQECNHDNGAQGVGEWSLCQKQVSQAGVCD